MEHGLSDPCFMSMSMSNSIGLNLNGTLKNLWSMYFRKLRKWSYFTSEIFFVFVLTALKLEGNVISNTVIFDTEIC